MDIHKAKDTTSTTGQVRFLTPLVGLIDITANENVDFSNGYATIEPPHGGGPFTSLTFTPVDDTAFSDFTFRGQVMDASVPLDVIVTDSSGTVFTIPFTIPKPNEDFGRLGVISLDGETIKSVELMDTGGFEEVKQIDFSLASGIPTIPEPATWALMLIGVGATGAMLRRRALRGVTAA